MLVSVAAVALVAVDVLYNTIIRSQGGPPPDQPLVAPFVTGYLAAAAVALAVSIALPPAWRAALRAACAAGLLVLAVLSGFSIGPAVLIPAAMCVAATAITLSNAPTRRAVASAITGAVLGLALLAGGFWVAWSYIQCPTGGVTSSGSTVTYTFYECVNGVLTTHP